MPLYGSHKNMLKKGAKRKKKRTTEAKLEKIEEEHESILDRLKGTKRNKPKKNRRVKRK